MGINHARHHARCWLFYGNKPLMVPVLMKMEMKFTPRKTKRHFCIPDFVTGKSVCGTSLQHLVTGNVLVIPSTAHQLLLGLAGGGAGNGASYDQGGEYPDFTSFPELLAHRN